MKANRELQLVHKGENINKFTDGEITIITGKLVFYDGKHHMSVPTDARAEFIRRGKRHIVKNVQRIAAVEEWYATDLLPQFKAIKPIRR